MNFRGGKHDDITITVAQIFQEGHTRKAHSEEFFDNLITIYKQSPKLDESTQDKKHKTAGWDELWTLNYYLNKNQ